MLSSELAIDRQPRIRARRHVADDLVSGVSIRAPPCGVRGTISCLACRRLSRSARCSRSCSSGSSSPPSRLSAISSSISSGRVDVPVRLHRRAHQAQQQQAAAVQPGDERAVDPERRHHRGRCRAPTGRAGAPATSGPARRRSPGRRSARAARRRRPWTAPRPAAARRGANSGASQTANRPPARRRRAPGSRA